MVGGLILGQLFSNEPKANLNFNLPSGLTVEEYKELMEFQHALNKGSILEDLKKGAIVLGLTAGSLALIWRLEEMGKLPPVYHTVIRMLRQIGEGIKAIGEIPSDIKKEVDNVILGITNAPSVQASKKVLKDNPLLFEKLRRALSLLGLPFG